MSGQIFSTAHCFFLEKAFDQTTSLFGFSSNTVSGIRPNGVANGEFEVTLEEVLHLITVAGYANAYPKVWELHKSTAVADAMDTARGGYFETVPGSYPTNARFNYDDHTREYNFMITKYFYSSLTSNITAEFNSEGGVDWC